VARPRPIVVSHFDLDTLGGRHDGDPPGKDASNLGPFDCLRELVLPESGALILRVLWRHKEKNQPRSNSYHRAFGPIDVPRLLSIHNGQTGRDEWALEWNGIWHTLGHDEIRDPCEALAAIVKDEARTTRGGK
jgi:hypothetical protein